MSIVFKLNHIYNISQNLWWRKINVFYIYFIYSIIFDLLTLWDRLVVRLHLRFVQIWIFFFLLKLSSVCTFWIVLMCWCQKWFLKNKKTSLTYISARKAIWKATATTLPNTLYMNGGFVYNIIHASKFKNGLFIYLLNNSNQSISRVSNDWA